ncbi:unnamed protein product [Prorocentrum cordatum]|uniref:Uncharacterized protein n=1 Tax=Prorocentrum cordatum TaxID=2364126 RepID=A0ABN9VMU9_9DINO|nr:unnamed protein product [Polarella glacialis]
MSAQPETFMGVGAPVPLDTLEATGAPGSATASEAGEVVEVLDVLDTVAHAGQCAPRLPGAEQLGKRSAAAAATPARGKWDDACMTCKGPLGDSPVKVFTKPDGSHIKRCRPCHNLRKRMYTLFRDNAELKSDFALVGAQARDSFIERAKSLFGGDLKLAIEEVIEVTLTTTRSQGFSGEGHWLDSEEIDKKFAGRPSQAAAIRRNARTMYDDDRECELWEVFDYKSSHNTSTSEQESRKRKATHEGVAKAAKAPKAKAKPRKEKKGQAEGDGEGGADEQQPDPEANLKVLTEGQKKTLEKAVQKLHDAVTKLQTLVQSARADEVKDYFPKRAVDTAAKQLEAAAQIGERADATLHKGKAEKGHPSAVGKEMRDTSAKALATVSRMQGLLDEAAADKAAEMEEAEAAEDDA